MYMESIACNLCQSDNYREHLVREDLNLYVPGRYRLVQCKQCGLIYLNPRPTADHILSCYQGDYDQYNLAIDDEKKFVKRLARRYGLWKRAKIILKRRDHGALLDVGCATGDFLSFFSQYPGWQVVGLEINHQAADYARRRFNFKVYTERVTETDLPESSFDVVTMWNVIEHLHDPKSVLYAINRLLKHEGLLVISTPDVNSLDARMFGKYWIGYEIPRHLYIFSMDTLTRLLVETGFRVINIRCVYGQHAAVASSLRFWLRAKLGRIKSIAVLEKIMFSYLFRVLMAPFFFLETRLMHNCSIPVIVAVKV